MHFGDNPEFLFITLSEALVQVPWVGFLEGEADGGVLHPLICLPAAVIDTYGV